MKQKEKELLEQIIIEEIDAFLAEEALEEGGYSRLMRSITGMEPGINSIGIMTAENPSAKKMSTQENKDRNKELASDLRKLGYGFYRIKGKFGNYENSFAIPNILKEDIIFLGEKYQQEAVIYIEKSLDSSIAQMISTNGTDHTEISRVVLPSVEADDFYSIYKGRKFSIPFFDDLFKKKVLFRGKLMDL